MFLMSEPIRLFIGTSANGEDAKAEIAYEYSLRANTDRELDIVWMHQTNDTNSFWYGWNDSRWSTPFSGFRWGIPEYCNFEGKAIYTDVDMVYYGDIGELYDKELADDEWMLARDGERFGGKEFCVILFDCAKFKDELAPVKTWKQEEYHHQYLMQALINKKITGYLDPVWNSHDGDAPNWKLLHYTTMNTQPWQPAWFKGELKEHPNAGLVRDFWYTYNAAITDGGYDIKDYDIDRGVTYRCIGQ